MQQHSPTVTSNIHLEGVSCIEIYLLRQHNVFIVMSLFIDYLVAVWHCNQFFSFIMMTRFCELTQFKLNPTQFAPNLA